MSREKREHLKRIERRTRRDEKKRRHMSRGMEMRRRERDEKNRGREREKDKNANLYLSFFCADLIFLN